MPAEVAEIQEAQAAEAVEAPAEEMPAAAVPELQPVPEIVEPEPVPVAEIPDELLRPEPEPVPVAADSTSIQDLPDTIWSISGRDPSDAGAIRFAEDIAELNRGGTGPPPRLAPRRAVRSRPQSEAQQEKVASAPA